MMMRALLDAEREQAASAVAAWLIKHAVEATARRPTGTNFVPVAIDPEAEGVHRRAFEEIPMLAVAS